VRLAVDENLDNDILRGLLRRRPDLNAVRAQDAGLSGADDPPVLEWCAREGRVLLTHDVRTMIRHANQRVADGMPMPGVIEVARGVPIGAAIEDILLVIECYKPDELEGRIIYVPL